MDVCIYCLEVVAYHGCVRAYHFFNVTAIASKCNSKVQNELIVCRFFIVISKVVSMNI